MKLTLKDLLILFGMAALITVALLYSAMRDQECREKGGTRIKVPGGTKCVQIKEIP